MLKTAGSPEKKYGMKVNLWKGSFNEAVYKIKNSKLPKRLIP